MVNQYMHDYNNVETIITSLRNIKKNYEDKIDEISLKKLVEESKSVQETDSSKTKKCNN